MSHHLPGALLDLARLFLKLGTLGFGGPVAHISMMEDEVVRRRSWLTHEEFLDLLGATNLIPGPNSTEMAIHIGFLRCGWRGLITGGVWSETVITWTHWLEFPQTSVAVQVRVIT